LNCYCGEEGEEEEEEDEEAVQQILSKTLTGFVDYVVLITMMCKVLP